MKTPELDARTQLAFNSGDLVFQEIITSRPYHNSATRVVSLNAVWPVTATFPSTTHASFPLAKKKQQLAVLPVQELLNLP
jgi:hypothetical protein